MCPSTGELIVSIRHLVYVTLYRRRFGVQVWMRLLYSLIQTCTPNRRLYRVTYTRCRIDKINSPDDGQMAARNMYSIEINIYEKELCVKLVIYRDLEGNSTKEHEWQKTRSSRDIKCRFVFRSDRLCGLVVRVSGYRYRGPGFDSRRYQIF